MLVLTRKQGEKIRIGSEITISVVEAKGNRVKIAIEAPDNLRILRGELCDWLYEEPSRPARKGIRTTREDTPEPDLVVTPR